MGVIIQAASPVARERESRESGGARSGNPLQGRREPERKRERQKERERERETDREFLRASSITP